MTTISISTSEFCDLKNMFNIIERINDNETVESTISNLNFLYHLLSLVRGDEQKLEICLCYESEHNLLIALIKLISYFRTGINYFTKDDIKKIENLKNEIFMK